MTRRLFCWRRSAALRLHHLALVRNIELSEDFVGIFTTETIVFGVLNLIEVEVIGRGPARLFAARNNGPDGRGVFDPRVSRLAQPIVREMTRIADLYFDSDAASEMRIWPFPAFRASEL